MLQFIRNTIRKLRADAYQYDPISGEIYTLDDFDIIDTEEELEFYIQQKFKYGEFDPYRESYTESDFSETLLVMYDFSGCNILEMAYMMNQDANVIRRIFHRMLEFEEFEYIPYEEVVKKLREDLENYYQVSPDLQWYTNIEDIDGTNHIVTVDELCEPQDQNEGEKE